MIDWSASMKQTFEFWEVDSTSWKDKRLLTNVKTCSITRDPEAETLGSATIDITESVGECYVRVYLIAIQGDIKEKIPLGTFLVQTPSSTYDGRIRNVSMDAYTPLLELKCNKPPIGFYVPIEQKGFGKTNVMQKAYDLVLSNIGAPNERPVNRVIEPITTKDDNPLTCNVVADINDTWLSFINDLITAIYTSMYYEVIKNQNGKYTRTRQVVELDTTEEIKLLEGVKTESDDRVYEGQTTKGYKVYFTIDTNNTRYKLTLDELGRIVFAPETSFTASYPVWTYTDDNSSILYPSVTMDHDMYDIPNVVEVLYSDGTNSFYSRKENNNPNSPISTHKNGRGRVILYRETAPSIYGKPTQERVDKYAEQLLETLSTVEHTITYTHGYCPVKVGDSVRLNYNKAGLTDIKARVVYQSIKCEPGCPVTEKAVYTTNLWR